MGDSARRRSMILKSRQRSWCCSFAVPPASPENLKSRCPKPVSVSKPGPNSVPHASPQSSKSGLNMNLVNRIDPRRILSPGRVSPIDSNLTVESMLELGPSQTQSPAADITVPRSRSGSFRAPNEAASSNSSSSEHRSGSGSGSGDGNLYDLRLKLKGRHGGCLVLEMNSGVLCSNSAVFADLIQEFNTKNSKNDKNKDNGGLFEKTKTVCRIEVPDVENLGVFRQTIELMFEENENLIKRLLKIGAYRCIDILEVSAGIMFTRGVSACLNYLEAVPWTEEEEEKLRSLFTRFKFDEVTARDILARLYLHDAGDSQQNLAQQLVWSITTCYDANARNELKSLVKGILCRSSVYEKEKDQPDLNKEDFYVVCQSCLGSLVNLFDEAAGTYSHEKVAKEERNKPLIERISRQVDNINWLLEILLERQMGEEFVDLWADQGKLLKLHETASPMIRYELSRVSANLFIAMGTRKLHCPWEARSALFQAWFGPMLSDFGWLQRCKKGLEMKTLEEAMGQTLLTLPLKHQYVLFMEWFRCFSKHGTECPNLSKSFQIWWRRSFLRGSETNGFESR